MFKPAACIWKYGPNHEKTKAASQEVFTDPECCKDAAFALKACKRCRSAQDLLDGPVGLGLWSSVSNREVYEQNIDLEADQAVSQHINAVRGSVGVEALCETAPLRQWISEHERRGLPVETKVAKSAIEQSGIPARKGKKTKKKGNYSNIGSGWVLYRAAGNRVWKQAMRNALAIWHPKRSAHKKKIRSDAYKERLFRREYYVPWKGRMAELWTEWKKDAALQAKWNLRAAQGACRPAKVAKKQVAPRTASPEEARKRPLWGAGWEKGPCSPEVMQAGIHTFMLQRDKSEHSKFAMTGPIKASERLQDLITTSYFVNDPNPRKEKLPGTEVKLTCYEKHPGMCEDKHAVYKDLVDHIATNCNSCFAELEKWDWLQGGVCKNTQVKNHLRTRELPRGKILKRRLLLIKPIGRLNCLNEINWDLVCPSWLELSS